MQLRDRSVRLFTTLSLLLLFNGQDGLLSSPVPAPNGPVCVLGDAPAQKVNFECGAAPKCHLTCFTSLSSGRPSVLCSPSSSSIDSGSGSHVRVQSAASGTCRTKKTWPKNFSQEELKKRLTPMQYHVTQEKGTESAFRGEYTDCKDEGTYKCVVCDAPLFLSDKKFDSGSGWPSFFDLINEESITLTDDFSYGMHRVETSCSQCGAHLGHLFDDGPRPTGKRYCINSASLSFQPKNAPPEGAESNGATGQSASSSKSEL